MTLAPSQSFDDAFFDGLARSVGLVDGYRRAWAHRKGQAPNTPSESPSTAARHAAREQAAPEPAAVD